LRQDSFIISLPGSPAILDFVPLILEFFVLGSLVVAVP
jgi:hypothetical protein